jgi:hypothetical protein
MVTYNVNKCFDSTLLEIITAAHEEHIDVIALQGTRRHGSCTTTYLQPRTKGPGEGYWIFEVGRREKADGLLLAFSAKRGTKPTLFHMQSQLRPELCLLGSDGKSTI